MNQFPSPEIWSLVSSGVSIIIGILAIVLTIWFFVLSKQNENNVTASLTKIETQALMLERITARQLDRLTKFVTQPQTSQSDKTLAEIIPLLKELPTNLIKAPTEEALKNVEALRIELTMAYGALYFYIAQANFWSQCHLPPIENFDATVPIQNEAKNILDLSAKDFGIVAGILSRIKPEEKLSGTPIEPLFQRTKDFWRTLVKSSSDVFIQRAKAAEKTCEP
jgi:hypothetical protein